MLDLCAGIGRLASAVGFEPDFGGRAASIVCVEQNPDYVRVGRVAVPKATWVQADVFDLDAYRHFGPFDCVISNPPFGRIKTGAALSTPRYPGRQFEYRVIELATRLSAFGVFIIPQESAPFRYSGENYLRWGPPGSPSGAFMRDLGIRLQPGIGVDTSLYEREWHGTSPKTEIVVYDAENPWGPEP